MTLSPEIIASLKPGDALYFDQDAKGEYPWVCILRERQNEYKTLWRSMNIPILGGQRPSYHTVDISQCDVTRMAFLRLATPEEIKLALTIAAPYWILEE